MEPDNACWERLQGRLVGRQQEIAERWHRALRSSGDVPGSTAARRRLAELTGRAIALLRAEPLDREAAQAIGAALVGLGFGEPEALGQTVTTLGQELLAGLPADAVIPLQPRLVALLAELAAGFTHRVQHTIPRAAGPATPAPEDRLRLVLEHAPLILFAVDRSGTIMLLEGSGLDSLSEHPERLVGQSMWAGVTAIPELADHLRRVLAGEAFTARVCYREAVFEVHYAPLRDARGRVSGAIGVAVDITTQAQAEAALRCAELGFSRREREVLMLLARADLPTYREIGAVLCVSRETVRTHLRAIARKLGVAERRADVVAAAYARGLLPPAS